MLTYHGDHYPIVCTVTGRAGLTATSVATKGASLDYRRQEIPSTVFDFAVWGLLRTMEGLEGWSLIEERRALAGWYRAIAAL